jgi:hypothetical protein
MADPPCPRAELHTDGPNNYVGWHHWAASMSYHGWRQSRCPGCRLYKIWSGGRRFAGDRQGPVTDSRPSGRNNHGNRSDYTT